MKGWEIINYVVRAKMPNREQIKVNILQIANEKQIKKRPIYRRSIATLLTAAVLVFCFIFGYTMMIPKNGNLFVVSAYAIEQQADGSVVMREVNLHTNDTLSGYSDDMNTYLNIGFKFKGKNIKNVVFSVNEGFFATQYISDEISSDVPKLFSGDGTLQLYGIEFEKIGNEIVLEKDDVPDDLLLFLGFESAGRDALPNAVTIRAIAEFNDGKTQEETIVIDIRDNISLMLINNLDELPDCLDAWKKIPIKNCELLPESVKSISEPDEYGVVYSYEATPNASPFIITENTLEQEIEFSENEIYRVSWMVDDINECAFMLVIKRNENDELTGMVYRVPEEIVNGLWEN